MYGPSGKIIVDASKFLDYALEFLPQYVGPPPTNTPPPSNLPVPELYAHDSQAILDDVPHLDLLDD